MKAFAKCQTLYVRDDVTSDLFEVGKRYIIYFSYGVTTEPKLVLDIPEDLSSECGGYLRAFLCNYYCSIDNNLRSRKVVGKIKDGYYSTNEWSEHLAVEVKSKQHLQELLSPVFIEYSRCLKQEVAIRNQFKDYCQVLLLYIRNKGVDNPTDVGYMLDELTLSTRFLGGFHSWSGGHGDMCDADELSRETATLIHRAIEDFNKKYEKLVKVEWQTGEKAYIYFNFIPKGEDLNR